MVEAQARVLDNDRPDTMTVVDAVQVLTALAQPTRLEIFRLLAKLLPEGLPATEIATTLNVPPTTLSFHLNHLTQAGLLKQRRSSRLLIYSVNPQGMRDLLGFLSEDCCHGRPELCLPARNCAPAESEVCDC